MLTIGREGDRHIHQGRGGRRAELFPEAKTRFFRKDTDVVTVFVAKNGRVTHVVHRRASGRESIGKRLA